jgi:hypothetical protein
MAWWLAYSAGSYKVAWYLVPNKCEPGQVRGEMDEKPPHHHIQIQTWLMVKVHVPGSLGNVTGKKIHTHMHLN